MMITQEKSMKTVSSTHSSGNTIQDYLKIKKQGITMEQVQSLLNEVNSKNSIVRNH